MTENKSKHTLFLREGDWDFLTDVYGPRMISTSSVVRTLVSTFVDKLRAQEKPTEFSDDGDNPRLDL